MTIKLIKISIAILLLAGLLGSSLKTEAFPAYLKQASKFGAKNCLFCHQKPEGGEGWNSRGEWLLSEKERRKADAIDVEWLSEYKEGEKRDEDKKDGDKADKKDADNEHQEEKENKENKKNQDDKKEEPKKKEKPE
jgi:hypothetical protein